MSEKIWPREAIGRQDAEVREAWWYSDRGGIDVLCATGHGQGGPTMVRLTWSKLRRAMESKARKASR